MYWMQHQLLLHHRALQSDCHELHREVTHDLRVMQGLVFTPADHFPHSLHVACPFAFHVLLDATFLDATVFKRCTVGSGHVVHSRKPQVSVSVCSERVPKILLGMQVVRIFASCSHSA